MKAKYLIAGALAALMLSGAAQAHRQWMLPSSTTLSGTDSWVTVDAAVSNDLFYFEHFPMRTDGVTVTEPDGTEGKIENAATGRYRSTFDVHLTKPGTYRIANVSTMVMGSYTLNGKQERLPRGTTKATLAQAIPAGATNVQTAEASNRNEIFVTLGAPTTTIFKPTGTGIEMVPVTHPNDLVSGETATFQFLLDGKPAADLKVTVIPGGIRYRDALGQMDLTTDKDGKLAVKWAQPGMYWLNASVGGGREGGEGAGPGGPQGQRAPGGEGAQGAPRPAGGEAGRPAPSGPPQRRASYISTLEVLAPLTQAGNSGIRIAIPPTLAPDLMVGRQRGGAIVTLSGATMGTSWSARIVDPAEDCLAVIEAQLARVIDQMSNWEPDSAISRFNRTPPGTWMPLPGDMGLVLRAGLEIAQLSQGAFDPAIGGLVARWGFGPGAPSPAFPAPWRCIEIEGDRARRTADVALDFSGIAKGFAVDAVAAALRARGMANFLVEIGGELRGEGIKPDAQPWWVDVEAPTGLPLPTLRVALSGLSVATSGDYRRFRMDGTRRLSHSIDPASGAPIDNDVASVTVLHDNAMLADAWATAITVMGHARGMALATRHGLPARLIRREGGTGMEYMTPALAAMLD